MSKARSRHTFIWGVPIWVVPTLVVMSIGTIWLRLAIVGTTYSIDQADKMIHSLQQEREQMRLKVTALRSPRRLEILAKTKFGWVQPKSNQVIRFRGVSHDN